MSQEQARPVLDEATLAVQTGRFQDALPLVDQALVLDPDNYEAFVLQGIALSQTNQPEEAIKSFRRAIELNPRVPKPYYNLAVHLYGLNRKEQALEMARKANEVDPEHENSHSLTRKIEQDLGMAAPPAEDFGAPEGSSYYRASEYDELRPGFENDPDVHSLPLVEKLGKNWITIGWVLTAIPLLLFGLGLVTGGLTSMPESMGRQMDLASVGGMAWGLAVSRIVFGFAAVTWMVMDIIDRRLNLIWLLPQIFCCTCTCGSLNWVIQLVYILTARKG